MGDMRTITKCIQHHVVYALLQRQKGELGFGLCQLNNSATIQPAVVATSVSCPGLLVEAVEPFDSGRSLADAVTPFSWQLVIA